MTRSGLLDIREREPRFATPQRGVRAVNGVSSAIDEGEAVSVVGASGPGKSQLFLSVLGLLARNGRARGSVRFRGEQLLGLSSTALHRVRATHPGAGERCGESSRRLSPLARGGTVGRRG